MKMSTRLVSCLFALALSALAVPLHAETSTSAPSLSVTFYKKIGEAYDWLKQKKLENARDILQKLSEQTQNTPYENGMVWNLLGNLHFQNGTYKASAQAYEKALQFDIPSQLAQDSRRMAGQAYLADGQYAKAAAHFDRWLAQGNDTTGDIHLQLAQCYYQTKDFKRAVKHLNTAIGLYETAGRQPKEEWLALLQASQAQVNDAQERIVTLKRLLHWYPKTEYWMALASAYGQVEKMDEYLATLSLAQQKDLLRTESQYLSLASLFYQQDVPLRAAQILETGLRRNIIASNAKNLRFLAACYSSAQEYEKALAPLQQAASQTTNGETDAQLGNAHFQLARWQDAAAAFETAIRKGDFKQLTATWLLLGQSYLNLHQYDLALAAFRQASLDEAHARQAAQWLQYTEYEKNRHEELGLIKAATSATTGSSGSSSREDSDS